MRKVTSELVTGDVVHAHGLRVRIEEVKNNSQYRQDGELLVTWSVGTVLNAEEAIKNGFPNGYLGRDGERRTWQIQGNDRAIWTVED